MSGVWARPAGAERALVVVVASGWVRGCGLAEEPVFRVRAGRAGYGVVPWVPSPGPLCGAVFGVYDELAVHGVTDPTLQGAERFERRLLLRDNSRSLMAWSHHRS